MKHFLFYLFISLLLQLTACSTIRPARRDAAPHGNIDVSRIPDATPRVEPISKYGNPATYKVFGKKIHTLKSSKGYNKVGFASWYGTKFHGALTSTREPYNLYAMTAASKDLPLPCYVQVTNLENGKSVIVRVNDRGPFVANRIIDLSYVAAKKLGYANKGTTLVRVTAIDPHLWAKNHNRFIEKEPQYAEANPEPVIHESRYYVQVGAFSNRANAESYRIKIAELTAAPVYIKSGQSAENTVYRVQVGPLAAVESNELREKLEAAGLAPAMNVIG